MVVRVVCRFAPDGKHSLSPPEASPSNTDAWVLETSSNVCAPPVTAQLVEHLTVDCCSNQMFDSGWPDFSTFSAPQQFEAIAAPALLVALGLLKLAISDCKMRTADEQLHNAASIPWVTNHVLCNVWWWVLCPLGTSPIRSFYLLPLACLIQSGSWHSSLPPKYSLLATNCIVQPL